MLARSSGLSIARQLCPARNLELRREFALAPHDLIAEISANCLAVKPHTSITFEMVVGQGSTGAIGSAFHVCLLLCLSIYLSVCLSGFVPVCLCLALSASVCLCLSFSLLLFSFVSLPPSSTSSLSFCLYLGSLFISVGRCLCLLTKLLLNVLQFVAVGFIILHASIRSFVHTLIRTCR